MTSPKKKKIDWFWAHRRNSSLHHVNILAQGFKAHGFFPPLQFWFSNQIFVGIPQKGVYFFYDRDEIDRQYKNVLNSIKNQSHFSERFAKKNDLIFRDILTITKKFRTHKLSQIENSELLKLYDSFISKITIAPVITVQLWSIEACFSDGSPLADFLTTWLKNCGKSGQIDSYKQLLCFSSKPSVAQKERIEFWQVIKYLSTKKATCKLFLKCSIKQIINCLSNYKEASRKVMGHIKKYEWVNSEYRSGPWPLERWIGLFKKSMKNNAEFEIKKIKNDLSKDLTSKKRLIKEMNPPQAVLKVIEAIDIFVAKRDWAKGLFSQALLDYSFFLNELARRIGISKNKILNYSVEEIRSFLRINKKIPESELKKRMVGFVFYSLNGHQKIISGKNIKRIIKQEKIGEPFLEKKKLQEFSGIPANAGLVRGRVRVIENLRQLDNFQKGEIMVTYMTTMEFTPSFRKAAGIITDEGGLSSHAAIISREFGIPCVVGTKIATRILNNGDIVLLNANKGLINIEKYA